MSEQNDDRSGRPARPAIPPFRGPGATPRGPLTPVTPPGVRATRPPFAPPAAPRRPAAADSGMPGAPDAGTASGPAARSGTPPSLDRLPPIPTHPAQSPTDRESPDALAPSADVFGDVAHPFARARGADDHSIDTERDVLEDASDWDLPSATDGRSAAPMAETAEIRADTPSAGDRSESVLSAYLAEEDVGAEQLAPMSPEDTARSEFAVPDHASELMVPDAPAHRSHPTPDRVFTAHGLDDAALIETDTHPVPAVEAEVARAGGGHANVYSDGTFAADTAASWDDTFAVSRASPPAAPQDASERETLAAGQGEAVRGALDVADALERVAQRIRTGELPIAGDAAGATEPAALAAALAALLGVRR